MADEEPVVDENTIDLSSGVEYDTISIDTSSMDSYNYSYSNIPPSITISNSSSSNYGAIGSSGSFLTSNGLNGTSWSNTWSIGSSTSSNPSSLSVKGDAEFEGKVMINGRNISEFMETIANRLAILQPDPAKLEHFAALKKAYEHYKTLEALCEIPKKENEE
jgi:hypothetical protein